MRILGIETSCDETAAAIVENGTKILSNKVASSLEIHADTGGIIPENAARKQIEFIIPVLDKSLSSALPECKSLSDRVNQIDAIAVTYGPGLIGSLLVGVETAKTLSRIWNKPIIPVNHLVAHIYANWLNPAKKPKLPALALVVSGGHTDLVLLHDHGNIVWIGGTRDDAAGEAFDKCARIIGLPYPGGPAISDEAKKFSSSKTHTKLRLFPRPMIDSKNFDWSFSGLKTSVLKSFVKDKTKKQSVGRLAAEIQEAIVDVLANKSVKAIKKYKPKSFLVSGGVAANHRLSEKLIEVFYKNKLSTELFIPLPKLCTDNAAVIAACAYYNYIPVPWKNISTNPQLAISNN